MKKNDYNEPTNEQINQVNEIIKESIEKNKPILKEMPSPTPPTFSFQSISEWDNKKDYTSMSQEELNNSMHQIVMQMFGFARTLAFTINGGKDKKKYRKIYYC